jgi:thiol-disulfide isomerase/thioredoxin
MFKNRPGRSSRPRSRVSRVLALLISFWSAVPVLRAADPAGGTAGDAVLHLKNGGYVPGTLMPAEDPGVIRWQSGSFAAAFDFASGAVNAIHFPVPATLPMPTGEYCFELSGGDVVYGSLLGLDGSGATLEIPQIGRVHVRRSMIHRMYRWKSSADLIYLGPNGLTGWREVTGVKSWREEQGQPWTDKDGSAIRGDFKLPARATLEFELSWKQKPDFVLAVGVGEDDRTIARAFRFEVWERDLVAQRETEREADVASVGEIVPGPGRVHLLAYLDQEKGRMLVFSAEGKPLADLRVGSAKPEVLASLSLANKRGDLRLERLRIGRWNGEPPRDVERNRSRIHRVDGSIIYGQVLRFDAASKAFVIAEASGERRVAEDQIGGVFLSQPGESPIREVAAVYQDGSRLGGDLLRVEEGSLRLRAPGIEEPLSLPVSGLRSIVMLRPQGTPPSIGELPGVLELDGLRLPGRLVDGEGRSGASCLVWQAQGSGTASPLRPGVSGRVVYKEPPPPAPRPQVPQRQAPQGPGGFVAGFLSALSGGGDQAAPSDGKKKSLFLRSGDVIPSEVTGIDERGVSFRTSLSASTFVPHEKVQAVELAQEATPNVKISKSKRERLLTLPRMQKQDPPTHLIRSRNGDYLRGRLIGMDDKVATVEVRLETKEIPRDRIASIIWLHPRRQDGAGEAAKSPRDDHAPRVQAVRNDGIRLTFVAERLSGRALSGKSDVLGPCRVDLRNVDQLLINGGIDRAAAQLAYQQWKLKDAPEPREAKDEDGQSSAGRAPGTESALIGTPAPDFELELLGGGKFRLAQHRGKAVILDFWATWCGPCLQAMPQVEKVAGEFRDRGVELFAVNLQEEPRQITSMLERHKLHPSVLLDRDGAVAEKYAANAIPQTVVIKGDGTIARLFVGGGSRLGDQLREAIDAVLKEESPPKATR